MRLFVTFILVNRPSLRISRHTQLVSHQQNTTQNSSYSTLDLRPMLWIDALFASARIRKQQDITLFR